MADDLKSYLVARFLTELAHEPRSVRVAVRYIDVLMQLNPKVVQRAKQCTARVSKSDPAKGRWAFKVKSSGSSNTHTVRVQFDRSGRVRDVNLLEVHVSCTCPAWKWWGPDYNANQADYLQGRKRSDGSYPSTRDPNHVNLVCKHVVAAATLFRKYKLQR